MRLSQKISLGILALAFLGILAACEEDDFNDGPFVSKRKAILSFTFNEFQPPVVGVINYEDSTVTATVPFGTDMSALIPTIEISDKATISPPSGVENDFTNTTTYIVTAENGTTQEWPVTVLEGEEEAQLTLKLSNPIWNLSPSGTGVPDFFTTDGERGMAYGNDHLYLTNNNDNILIIDPENGSVLSSLDMTGIDGGTPKIADVEVSGGAILACNTVEWTSDEGGAPTEFKIYLWDNEDDTPEVFLSYTNTQYRMGDSFSVIGDINTNAVILTAFGRKFLNPTDRGDLIFRWNVTNGVVDDEPELITVGGVPTLTKLGSRPHVQMMAVESEFYYVNANDIEITKVGLDGTFETRLPNSGRQLYDGFSSYFEIFEFLDKTVLITAFPRSNIESRLIVLDITDGIGQVTEDDVILSQNFMEGSGEIANINAGGAVTFNIVDENNVEVYCLITNQAVAKFNLTAELQ